MVRKKKKHNTGWAWNVRHAAPSRVVRKDPKFFKDRARIDKSVAFYASDAWLRLRYQALKLHGGRCQCCGTGGTIDNPLQVDHIKPRSKFPELQYRLSNLQVLCKQCNKGKGAWDQTDWRGRNVIEKGCC